VGGWQLQRRKRKKIRRMAGKISIRMGCRAAKEGPPTEERMAVRNWLQS